MKPLSSQIFLRQLLQLKLSHLDLARVAMMKVFANLTSLHSLTRATFLKLLLSVHQTVSHMPQLLQSLKRQQRHTTRSLFTVNQVWVRLTCFTLSVHMQKSYMAMSACVMYLQKNLPTTLLTQFVTIKQQLSSAVTATSISCLSMTFNS